MISPAQRGPTGTPGWVDSTYAGGNWSISTSGRSFRKGLRITLNDFSHERVEIEIYFSPSFEGAEKTLRSR
jgi:hypothetical protein